LLEQAARLRTTPLHSALHALWPIAVSILIALIMFRIVGPVSGGFATKVMLVAGINIVLAVSLTVVNGFTGQFSLGHAGFMAVGGYVAAGIVYYGSMRIWGTAESLGGALSFPGDAEDFTGSFLGKGDLLFLISCLIGGLVAAGAGWVVGLPSLRLRGDYLAIVTLGFGEIVRVLLQGTKDQIQPWKVDEAQAAPWYELPILLGGPKGFNLLPIYTTLFWVYLCVGLTLIFVYRLKSSSTGRAFLSIREDEIAAQAMGVDITKYKVRAFVLSSFLAGVAGALYGLDIGAISATELGFQKSFDIIIMVVLGGMGSISGATLAAIILTILPELLRDPPPVWPAGAVVLAIMIVVQAVRKRWRIRPLVIVAIVTAGLEIARQLCVKYGVNIAEYRLVLYALMLILMMILRPDGLFGVNELWDYFGRRRKRLIHHRAKEQRPTPAQGGGA
jgi:branched-chain amino acid transport system permease protein